MSRSRLWAGVVVVVIGAGAALGWPGRAVGAEIGFVEQFVLAENRAQTLLQLIPGTEDYYYYHCLYYQTQEQFDKVPPLLAAWAERPGRTPRWTVIDRRQQLLTYDQHPQVTLEYLRQQLGLAFDHQKQGFDSTPDLPTALDPQAISRQALEARARSQHVNLEGFEDAALWWLIDTSLNEVQRRELLARWPWPHHPQLVSVILEDLRDPNSPRFGGHPIHLRLLRDQLDQLAGALPELLASDVFVQTYLRRLQPTADEDILADLEARGRYLDRLQTFADRLPPSFNSLRAYVLYHQLQLDRRRGKIDRQKFFRYVALPRSADYVNPRYLERHLVLPESQRGLVDLGASFGDAALLPPIGGDEPLIREILLALLVEETSLKDYTPYFREEYLKPLLAETKIVHGVGKPDEWARLLTPEQYQALRDRVDLDFAADNPEYFAAGDAVALDLVVKNVETLLVKIYRINALKFFQEHPTQINTDIDLDGLTPGHELRLEYQEPAVRRVRRHLELPQLTEPGTYVVDFIGNGKSSRALVRKGRLSFTESLTAAGHQLRLYDERGQLQAQASVWLAGHLFSADKDGNIVIPFSRQPGPQPIVLVAGKQTTLGSFQHLGEQYRLEAGFLVDREQLLQHRRATIWLRTALYLNDHQLPIELLKEPAVAITTTNLDGVSSTKVLRELKLENLKDTELAFQVPPRVVSLTLRLTGKVENLAQRDEQELASERAYPLNQIEQTDQIEAVQLVRDAADYRLQVLGKSGEPQPDRVVQLRLKHRDFREEVPQQLKTDAAGFVQLGPLAEILSVTASSTFGGQRTWLLTGDQVQQYSVLHARAGEPFAVAYAGTATRVTAEEFSLLEMRGEVPVADQQKKLKLAGRLLSCAGLDAGEYQLLIRSTGQQLVIRVAGGQRDDAWLVGPTRHLEVRPDVPLQIQTVGRDKEQLVIQLAGANDGTRVIVVGARFEPSFPLYSQLANIRGGELTARLFPQLPSALTTGRAIGDEYRYILQRQYAKRYPGNMLERPELLLNPWQLQDTATTIQELEAAQAPAAAAPPPESSVQEGLAREERIAAAGDLPNLDFLPAGSRIVANLTPDDKGQVRVPLEQFGDRHDLHILALSPTRTAYHRLTGALPPMESLDLRLAKSIAIERHAVLYNQAQVLAQGQTLTLPAGRDAKWEVYDQLSKVYQVLAAASGNPEMVKFQFLLRWHELTQEQKQKFYSEYACHELHFFLYRKDRPFFDAVVQPLLKNKRELTLVDRWLLEQSLAPDTTLPSLARLNVWEQIQRARRQAEELEALRRRLGDLWVVRPPQPQLDASLFDFAVSGLLVEDEKKVLLGKEFDAPLPMLRSAQDKSEKLAELKDAVRLDIARNAAETNLGIPAGRGAGFGGAYGAVAGVPPSADGRAGAMKQDLKLRYQWNALQNGAIAAATEAAPTAAGDTDADTGVFFSRSYAVDLNGRERLLKRGLGFYVPLESTKEWAESNYYHVLRTQQLAELVPLNAYWLDYARHDPAQPFLSTHFLEAKTTLSEMLLVLATLDLPAKTQEHDIRVEGDTVKLTAASPLIVFYEDLKDAQPEAATSGVLVNQNFFQQGDRNTIIDGQQAEKYITGEFLTDRVYGCKVVVTNTTSLPKTVHLLLQIPAGALPVQGTKQTRSATVRMEAYRTENIEYLFYFPIAGTFTQYPVHVRSDDQLIAFAEPRTLQVVDRPTQIDKKSWAYLSQEGTNEEVLDFLRQENLYPLNLDLVAFRLKDADFFQQLTELLSGRQYYHPTVWSYAIRHGAVDRIREYLTQVPGFVAQCGLQLKSQILEIDAESLGLYEHLEYKPLVNARAHQVGAQREILNDRLYAQYHRWLDVLSYQSGLGDRDKLATIYYLLVQDRIDEALTMFASVDASQLNTTLQYDYLAAYLDFFQDDPRRAEEIAERYKDYPVDHWRRAFAEIRSQLAEFRGQESLSEPKPEDPFPRQDQLASQEPAVDLTLDGKTIQLDVRNLESVLLNYYLIDVEHLFSGRPFVEQQRGQFAFVEPNFTQQLAVPAGQRQVRVPLPDDLARRHLYVEAVAAGKSSGQLYYANSLEIAISDRYGQLAVQDASTGRALPKTYVKVYGQMQDGSVQFYKDGYTDLRGKFDYVSISTNQLDQTAKLAVLVLSDTHGAAVREVSPPKR